MNIAIADFIASLFFSLVGIVITGLELASASREKKKIKEEENRFKYRIICSEKLLSELRIYSDVQKKLQEVLESDFDTVTLSSCDLRELAEQCDRVLKDLKGTVNILKETISTFNKMVRTVITQELYLPKACVSLALSMEEINSNFQLKTTLFENNLGQLSWECILFKNEVAIYFSGDSRNDKKQLEKMKNELYSHTYQTYLEYIELCELIKVIFEKYEIIIYSLQNFADTVKKEK